MAGGPGDPAALALAVSCRVANDGDGDLRRFRAGTSAPARAISLVERRDPAVRALETPPKGRDAAAAVVGFTGAPGTGKSTLVDALVTLLRKQDRSVAVIATDPNSPFTGGAILGDRIRMQRHALDPKVFIRSMGARGHLGGLSLATREAIRLLGAFGFDQVILETVGVGQSELEVAAVADTTVVVMTPEPRGRRADDQGGDPRDRRHLRRQQSRPRRLPAGGHGAPRDAQPQRASSHRRRLEAVEAADPHHRRGPPGGNRRALGGHRVPPALTSTRAGARRSWPRSGSRTRRPRSWRTLPAGKPGWPSARTAR